VEFRVILIQRGFLNMVAGWRLPKSVMIGLTHVSQTTSLALKQAIYHLLAKQGLSPSRIRGQGYDGASNMQGRLNGLKTLVMED
jgi:hypothetical protein